jgi:hypothetical protein
MSGAQAVPIFVELCAGTAAVSLRLNQPKAKPPASRLGTKTGYADAILYHLHLQPGQGAESYLWCDPDPGVRLMLEAYRDPALAREAADVIRSWADEDPRALWGRLRAEGAPSGVTGRELGRMAVLWRWSYRSGQPESGFNAAYVAGRSRTETDHGSKARTVWLEADLLLRAARSSLASTIHADARHIGPVRGAVVYIDPPYVNTTGYAHDLPRAEVERLALAWAEAGATVAISEAEPIALPGWEHVEITGERKGQKRTFSKQQAEWLTIWRSP